MSEFDKRQKCCPMVKKPFAIVVASSFLALILIAYLIPYCHPAYINPNPEMDRLKTQTARIVIMENDPKAPKVSFEISDRNGLGDFFASFRLIPYRRDNTSHCTCDGNPLIEFWDRDKRVAVITVHHNARIRWRDHTERPDIPLQTKSKRQLKKLFTAIGISTYRQEHNTGE